MPQSTPDVPPSAPPREIVPPVEADLPAQNRRDWHPERLAAEIDELHESHLIRGYD